MLIGEAGLRGAGPVTVARLAAHRLVTVADLLDLLPRAYDDFRRTYLLEQLTTLEPGTAVVVCGRIGRVHLFPRRLLDVHIEDAGVRLRARWFRPRALMAKSFVKGSKLALCGILRRADDNTAELIHPRNVTAQLEMAAPTVGLGIRPRYPKLDGVPERTLEKIIAGAVASLDDGAPEILPSELRRRLELPARVAALRAVHLPGTGVSAADLAALAAGESAAHRRLAFEYFLVLQMSLRRQRAAVLARRSLPCGADPSAALATLRTAVTFPLTCAQERAIALVFADLACDHPMQRMLAGDVGSGKTVVVFAAALLVARSGGQSLLMAPTELLAEQHARTLDAWGRAVGLRVALLTAGLPRAQQEASVADLRAGKVDLLVGTQSLLDDRVQAPRLALAIIDEQHRFGVRQRAHFRRSRLSPDAANSGILPHLLVLTATPIPRTLALTIYGDLDRCALDELPPGRAPVRTEVAVGEAGRARALAAIVAAVAAGRQAYVVCPAIGETETASAGAAVQVATVGARHKQLRQALRPARVAMLHGRLEGARQEEILRDFRAKKIDVLVATTVIEVGVDVPNATVMVIEDAARLGLAQLHQLRGRVGRGAHAASCWLCVPDDAAAAGQRLMFVAGTNDGLRIAEEDLRVRGPGDLFGARQTGAPRGGMLDSGAWIRMVEMAHDEVDRLLSVDPELVRPEHRMLREAAEARMAAGNTFAEEAG